LAAIERGGPTPSLDVAPFALGQFVVICRATSASGAVTLRATPIARVNSLALASALRANDTPRFVAVEQPQALSSSALLTASLSRSLMRRRNRVPMMSSASRPETVSMIGKTTSVARV
jgi:hypothetical protein